MICFCLNNEVQTSALVLNSSDHLCWGALPAGTPQLPRMRMSLPRHDLLGEERWPDLSKEKGQERIPQWAFIGFNLHRNTGKAHQSLSGSKDQIIVTNKEL